jgi:amidohydrolase
MPHSMNTDLAGELRRWIDHAYPDLLTYYQELHASPELSGKEQETAERLAQALAVRGMNVTTGVGGHGVVGVFENGPGPTVLIRAEMDALPIEEKTQLPYASRIKTRMPNGLEIGVMHACGHDLHMATLVGTAGALIHGKEHWGGRLLCIGQPSEEMTSGARAMIADGLYQQFPRPDYALALHVGPGVPLGTVGYHEQLVSAGSQSLDLTIRGMGGHAAYPDTAKDPVVLAAQTVLALQTIRSRELGPLQFGIVTVAAIHGGFKHNAIPDEVMLRVNIRFFDRGIKEQIIEAIRRIADGLAVSAGMPKDRMPILRAVSEGAPPLENDPEVTRRVTGAIRRVLGDDRVIEIPPLTGSEDFGYFRDGEPHVSLCYLRLGVDPAEKRAQAPYLHSPLFAPTPEAMKTGILSMTVAALTLMGRR